MEVTIGGKIYKLTDRPLRKDVVRVRRLQKAMLYELFDLTKITGNNEKTEAHMEVSTLVTQQILTDPKKFAAFSDIDQEMRTMGTIMLVSGMTQEELMALPNQDFVELLEKCKTVLGGDAQDFLKASGDSMFSMPQAATMTTTGMAGSDSGTSPPANQQGNSSEARKNGQGERV